MSKLTTFAVSELTELAVSEAVLLLTLVLCEVFVPSPFDRAFRYAVLLLEELILFFFSVNLPALIEMQAAWYVALLFFCGLVLYFSMMTGSMTGEFFFTTPVGTPGSVRATGWFQAIAVGILFALLCFDCGYLIQHAFGLPGWSKEVLALLGYYYGSSISNVKIGSCPWCGKRVGARASTGAFRSCRHCGEPYFHSDGKLHRGKGVMECGHGA